MIEATIRNYLDNNLNVEVYTEIPSDPPKTFVRLEKTGGSKTDWIRTATIAIQSYADTMAKASSLNEQVILKMENIITISNITQCDLNSDYNYTDTTTKRYRYQAVFNVVYY